MLIVLREIRSLYRSYVLRLLRHIRLRSFEVLVEFTIVSVVFNVTRFSYFTMVNARHRIDNGGGIKAKFTIVRDGPLEKLWGGGGEFSSCRNFFRYQIPYMNFFRP